MFTFDYYSTLFMLWYSNWMVVNNYVVSPVNRYNVFH